MSFWSEQDAERERDRRISNNTEMEKRNKNTREILLSNSIRYFIIKWQNFLPRMRNEKCVYRTFSKRRKPLQEFIVSIVNESSQFYSYCVLVLIMLQLNLFLVQPTSPVKFPSTLHCWFTYIVSFNFALLSLLEHVFTSTYFREARKRRIVSTLLLSLVSVWCQGNLLVQPGCNGIDLVIPD